MHINPALGHLELTKLSPQHVQRYMNDKVKPIPQADKEEPKPGLSAKTVRYHRSILVMALKKACRWGMGASERRNDG